MAQFAVVMMKIALELAKTSNVYEDLACKYFEHYVQVRIAYLHAALLVGFAMWEGAGVARGRHCHECLSFASLWLGCAITTDILTHPQHGYNLFVPGQNLSMTCTEILSFLFTGCPRLG